MKNVRVAGALLQVRSLLFFSASQGLDFSAPLMCLMCFTFLLKTTNISAVGLLQSCHRVACQLRAPYSLDEKVYTYMRCWRDYVAQISLLLVRTSIRKKTKRWKGIYDNIDWNWPLPFRVSVRTIDLTDEYAQSSPNNNGNEDREKEGESIWFALDCVWQTLECCFSCCK